MLLPDDEDDSPPPKIDDCSPLLLELLSPSEELPPPNRFVTFSTTVVPTARSFVAIPPRFALLFAAPFRPAALRRAEVVLREADERPFAELRDFVLLLRADEAPRLALLRDDFDAAVERFAPPPLLRFALLFFAPLRRLADEDAPRLAVRFFDAELRALLFFAPLDFEPPLLAPLFFALLFALFELLLLLLFFAPPFFAPLRADDLLADDFEERDLELDLPEDDRLLEERFFAGMSCLLF